MSRIARVHRLDAAGPSDLAALDEAVAAGRIDPARVVAVLGKTEGNGCVNDFTRGYATESFTRWFATRLSLSPAEVERRVVMVMSGGTEGCLAPHWLVFEEVDGPAGAPGSPRLALGAAATRELLPEEIGCAAHVAVVRDTVLAAMQRAGIASAADVHYVQVKCPLLTKQRVQAASARGQGVATEDTYTSMAFSRGASALGVAAALGELPQASIEQLGAAVCRDPALYSSRASTSAGIELMDNQVLVLGNSTQWGGDLRIAHRVMQDAIDLDAVQGVLADLGFGVTAQLGARDRERLVAVLAKAEPSRTGAIRGARHTMLDDSDIQATRHARAAVGGVLAAMVGDTRLFVSGGAEHQGPDGGGPVAAIARV